MGDSKGEGERYWSVVLENEGPLAVVREHNGYVKAIIDMTEELALICSLGVNPMLIDVFIADDDFCVGETKAAEGAVNPPLVIGFT
jgi:hypothetical protein